MGMCSRLDSRGVLHTGVLRSWADGSPGAGSFCVLVRGLLKTSMPRTWGAKYEFVEKSN